MTLFLGLPLAIRGNSQSSHIIRPRNERWRIINSTDDVVVDHTTTAVLLDSRCTAPRRSRCSRMDHGVGVCRCKPRRCLRLELDDVSTCAQRDRVAGMCKLAEEGEGRRERATGRGESGCNKLVASGPYCIAAAVAADPVAAADSLPNRRTGGRLGGIWMGRCSMMRPARR